MKGVKVLKLHVSRGGRYGRHYTGWLGSGRDREEEVRVLTGLERAAKVAGGGWPAGREGAAERGAPRERSPQSRARHRAR